jgi:integrase
VASKTEQPWRRESPVLKPDFRRGLPAANKGKEYPPAPLDRAEVMALFDATPKRGPRGKRDRALLAILYGAGARIGETLQLRESDLNRATGAITLRRQTTKGHKARTIGLPPEAWAHIEVWIAERRRLGISGHKPVFCTVVGDSRGRPLQRSVWTTSLHRLAKRAGVDKRVTSHQLRHTWTFEYVVKEGGPLLLAQKQLGHARIDTTVRYADHVAPRDLIEANARRRWTPELPAGGVNAAAIAGLLELLQRPDAAELLQALSHGLPS